MKTLLFTLGLLSQTFLFSQYAPAVGQTGTTAIKADSSIIVNWATTVLDFSRGYQNIAVGNSLASVGIEDDALGTAQAGGPIVSLGDNGIITLGFQHPIKNGNGPDFAVFENSFSNTFLELAHVEVSTNGIDFIRIPSISLTQTTTQIDGFGTLDPTKIHNLAGKYRAGYGTPFDLEDIIDSTGINLDSINYVRIIDVVGTINTTYANYDSQGNIINDPYPTPFSSCGFDLDAIGVINENKFVGLSNNELLNLCIFPNPSNGAITIKVEQAGLVEIFNMQGELIINKKINSPNVTNIEIQTNGVYLVKFTTQNQTEIKKIVISK